MKLLKNGFITSCSPNLIILTETKIENIKFDFQSQFSMSKIIFIILIFVSVKIIRLGEQLLINHYLITSFFEIGLYFCRLTIK